MKIEANITPTTGSPPLIPRAAQAVAAAKAKAERLTAADTDPTLPDAAQKPYEINLPDSLNSRVDLSVDKETGLVIGKVIDRDTGKEVRQIPSESMVRLIRATREELGPLVDVKI